MTIVYGINSDYLIPALVSAWSVFKNASKPVEIVIYGEGLNVRDIDIIHRFSLTREIQGEGKIVFKPLDRRIFEGCLPKDTKRWPAVTLLPLALPQLIEGRCIFLDADTLILGDIWELLDIDLHGHPIGACSDLWYAVGSFRPIKTRVFEPMISRSRAKNLEAIKRIVMLGFVPSENYFNSGVIVMDCNKIRNLPNYDKLLSPERISVFPEILLDQDALNEFFFENWFQIPVKWNAHPKISKYAKRVKNSEYVSNNFKQQLNEAASRPMLWHYMNSKPWRGKKLKNVLFPKAFKDWKSYYKEYRSILESFQ